MIIENGRLCWSRGIYSSCPIQPALVQQDKISGAPVLSRQACLVSCTHFELIPESVSGSAEVVLHCCKRRFLKVVQVESSKN
jgi:hypothetical protein